MLTRRLENPCSSEEDRTREKFKANNLSFGQFGPVLGTAAEVTFAALRGGVFKKVALKLPSHNLNKARAELQQGA